MAIAIMMKGGRVSFMEFIFHDDVKSLGINGMYFVIEGLTNRKSDPEFDRIQQDYFGGIDIGALAKKTEHSDILQGYRDLHKAVNCSDPKVIAASENLVRFFIKRGSLPKINLLVDIYNFVSFRSELAVGAHDTALVSGNVSLRFTNGSENFFPIGHHKAIPVKAGEYGYIDDANDILCRLDVRQVEKTKITEQTANCFYIVQGNRNTPPEKISEASDELIRLTLKYCGGKVTELYSPDQR
jgi:DNA/RNA-binding domain of Phe-tRNA-synthetase-like protein